MFLLQPRIILGSERNRSTAIEMSLADWEIPDFSNRTIIANES